MSSEPEFSVCYQNRSSDQRDPNNLVQNVQLDNSKNVEVEQGFRNLDSTVSGKIRNISIIIQDKCSSKCGNTKSHVASNWLNILLVLFLTILFILAAYTIVINSNKKEKEMGTSVKCKICGPGIKWHTMLGDVYGNVCNNDSEEEIYDCGAESTCFKMEVTQSNSMSNYLNVLKEHLKNISHPYSDYPLLHNGILKGCLNGFIWDEKCHYFNTSLFYPNAPYWTSTNTCTCTTNNCN
jgi:hypothetical protein